MKNISQEEWKAQLYKDEKAVIIDVRTPEECTTGIMKKAIMIDFLQPDYFSQEIKKLDKLKTYYIYCRSGNRSRKACQIMESFGFNQPYNLVGGMNEWKGEKVILN